MFIVLDNAESILDPQGAEGQEIYGVVRELSQFGNICLTITSRITTIPPDCERLDIPTLSIDAARTTFHRIYRNNGRPDTTDKILEQLDFHPLSLTLLATVARQNNWDNDRLAREWEQRQTGVLRTEHNESLAAAIELSLTSPMFKNLGPDARELLGVIAFFPQGVDENNLDWLFPTISNRTTIFDKFTILSLTHRNNGFITMLVPLRDYLRPRDPLSSPLLCAAKDRYFARMSTKVDPDTPWFGKTRWIVSEDTNVEHMITVFASVDRSNGVWSACLAFLKHLYWHKPRRTVLGPKIEALPDDHSSKPDCLYRLAQLLGQIGNHAERKQLLHHVLKLGRDRENDSWVASTLKNLSDANHQLGFHKEGVRQAREVVEIYERTGHAVERGDSLIWLARSLHYDDQLDAAEEAASRAIALLPKKGQEYRFCRAHRVLGDVYHSKGEGEKAIHHLETAIAIASPLNWADQLFWAYYTLAILFCSEDRLDDAQATVEQAKSCAANDIYDFGCAVLLQAGIWFRRCRLEDATSEALSALKIFENLGAEKDIENCRDLLRNIERSRSTPGESDPGGEFLGTIPFPARVNFLLSIWYGHLGIPSLRRRQCIPTSISLLSSLPAPPPPRIVLDLLLFSSIPRQTFRWLLFICVSIIRFCFIVPLFILLLVPKIGRNRFFECFIVDIMAGSMIE